MKVVLLSLLLAVAVNAVGQLYSVSVQDGNFLLAQGQQTGAAAWGIFSDDIMTTGWGHIEIHTNKNASDDVAMGAAGYLEGAVTAKLIGQSFINYWADTFDNAPADNLLEYIVDNIAWTRSQIADIDYNNPSDDFEWQYWAQVGLVVAQFDGIVAGYAKYKTSDLPDIDEAKMWLLNAEGDTDDLIPAMQHQASGERGGIVLTPERLMQLQEGSHCSSIVKPSQDGKTLWAAHEMWSSFAQMIEMYKHYTFDLQLSSTAAVHCSMSSYPAFISSEDDFYLLSSGMQVMETTNMILNVSLYDKEYVQPKSLLSWIRVVVANRMAHNGSEWSQIFELYNSGTYNNQWILVDHSLFFPGRPVQPNTLWICSQIPGMVMSADVTDVMVKQGYWPSYNIPYFTEIYDITGYPHALATLGNAWSYTQCARAQVFKRDQGKAQDLKGMQALMRENNYQTDPLALGCPTFQLAARADLSPVNQKPEWGGLCGRGAFGAINAKISSSDMIRRMEASVIAGPTHETLPPFDWSVGGFNNSHVGQPTRFDFAWITAAPQQFQA